MTRKRAGASAGRRPAASAGRRTAAPAEAPAAPPAEAPAEAPATAPARIEEPTGGRAEGAVGLVDQLVTAVTRCPAVAELAPGPVATYLPGRRVTGVAVREESIEVAIVARYGIPLVEAAEQVRTALRELAPNYQINVSVDDIEPPDNRVNASVDDIEVDDIEPPAGPGNRPTPSGARVWKG